MLSTATTASPTIGGRVTMCDSWGPCERETLPIGKCLTALRRRCKRSINRLVIFISFSGARQPRPADLRTERWPDTSLLQPAAAALGENLATSQKASENHQQIMGSTARSEQPRRRMNQHGQIGETGRVLPCSHQLGMFCMRLVASWEHTKLYSCCLSLSVCNRSLGMRNPRSLIL